MMILLLTDPQGNTTRHPLPECDGASLMLGRADDCDIVIPSDSSLSRRHALLFRSGGMWYVRDNNSVNGICLGTTRVSEIALYHGTVLSIAATRLEAWEEQAEATPMPQGEPAAAGAPARPRPRAVRRAGTSTARRRLSRLPEEERPVSAPGASLGLPCEFEFGMQLTEPRHRITEGSVLRFAFTAARACHLCLIQHDAAGAFSVLLPDEADPCPALPARRTTVLPPRSILPNDELIAAAPFGTDTVIAIACTEKTFLPDYLRALAASTQGATTPGEAEQLALTQCRADAPEAVWSSAVLRLTTHPAPPSRS